MLVSVIAKNILEGKVCDTCTKQHSTDSCVRWWGESVGWQWGEKSEDGTCEDWTNGNS